MSNPGKTLRGIRDSMPANTLLGRVGTNGPPTPVDIGSIYRLMAQFTQPGQAQPAGATNSVQLNGGNGLFAAVLLGDGQILVGQSGAPLAKTMSGDGSLSSAGALTVTKTNGVAFATSATTDTTNASNISSGTLPAARLPAPTSSTLGGVKSLAAASHQFLTQIGTDGTPAQVQPAAGDLSDYAAGTWTPADSSGASLSLSNKSASYTRIGNLVFISCYVTYPSTADTNHAGLSGLPVAVANANYGYCTGIVDNDGAAVPIFAQTNKGASTLNFFNSSTGAAVTNAQLTGYTINFSLCYPVA